MAQRRSNLKLFLDSSVFFTAVNSPTGGSAKIFSLVDESDDEVDLVVSNVVLHEVEKNVRQKLHRVHLQRFFMLVRKVAIIDELVTKKEFNMAETVIAWKDAMILAQFCRSNCDCLITLDKRDFLQKQVFEFAKPKKILTPKEFFDLSSLDKLH